MMLTRTRMLASMGGLLLTAMSGHAQPTARPPDCASQQLVDVARIKEQVILVGEPHGTREIPVFVAGLVCSLLKANRSVILALERDGHEQSAFNKYIDSDGGADAKQELTSFYEWRSKCPDGRSSVAMLELIDEIRRLKKSGQRVALLAFREPFDLNIPTTKDELLPYTPDDNALSSVITDRAFADNLMHMAIAYRQYTIVALSGSGHTSTVGRALNGHPWEPMGKHCRTPCPLSSSAFAAKAAVGSGHTVRTVAEISLCRLVRSTAKAPESMRKSNFHG